MYRTSDLRKNLKIKMDNAPWTVVEFLFVKPGKGTAFTRTKLKNLITGQVIERNFRSGEQLEPVDMKQSTASMLYRDGEDVVFMDGETYDQFPVPVKTIGDKHVWLRDGMNCDLLFYEGRCVAVDMPNFVELDITYTEPAVKGDTATNTTKLAEVDGGGTVQVPLFVSSGERIKVDTRSGEYSGRIRDK